MLGLCPASMPEEAKTALIKTQESCKKAFEEWSEALKEAVDKRRVFPTELPLDESVPLEESDSDKESPKKTKKKKSDSRRQIKELTKKIRLLKMELAEKTLSGAS